MRRASSGLRTKRAKGKTEPFDIIRKVGRTSDWSARLFCIACAERLFLLVGDTTPHWELRLWIFAELIGAQPDMLLEEFAER